MDMGNVGDVIADLNVKTMNKTMNKPGYCWGCQCGSILRASPRMGKKNGLIQGNLFPALGIWNWLGKYLVIYVCVCVSNNEA